MAKDNKKLVQAITSQEENFAQWYTDICVKAELVEYSSVKGFIIRVTTLSSVMPSPSLRGCSRRNTCCRSYHTRIGVRL